MAIFKLSTTFFQYLGCTGGTFLQVPIILFDISTGKPSIVAELKQFYKDVDNTRCKLSPMLAVVMYCYHFYVLFYMDY